MSFKRWTGARRGVQIGVLLLILSQLMGWQAFRGNLAAADLLGIPLADPLAALQAVIASRVIVPTFLGSALAVTIFYLLVGGRTFCAWICPVYLLTEMGDKLRGRLGSGERTAPLELKKWVLLTVLVLTAITGLPLFETLSPIGMVVRSAAFGSYPALSCLLGLVLLETVLARRLWCRSLCPLGGLYALVGRISPTRVGFSPGRCTACGECARVCPVEEVLAPSLDHGVATICSGECTRCGACIDACTSGALRMHPFMRLGTTDSDRRLT
jgi:ferredoxin-type protein NapH